MLIGKPCEIAYFDDYDDNWKIGSHGEIFVDTGYNYYDHTNSCLEYVQDPTKQQLSDGLHAVFCFDEEEVKENASNEENYDTFKYNFKYVSSFISCFFLTVLLIVYVCLPTLQNLHGKTIMCHALSLILAYACLGIITITSKRLIFSDVVCVNLGS